MDYYHHTSLTAADQETLDAAVLFADTELRPRAQKIDQGECLPKEVIRGMGERRFLGATFPKELGGLGLDPVAYGLLTEIIGAACANTRALMTLGVSLVGESILKWGSPQQISRWIPAMAEGKTIAAFALSEPDHGSDAKNITTSYRREGSQFILNGQKRWTSFGVIADLILVIARDGETTTAFLVDRNQAGIVVRPMNGLLGMRGSHVSEVVFREVAVPEDCVLGGVGNGFTYVASTALDHGRYSIAWAGQAICSAALEAMVGYARSRAQFGKRLHEFQLIQGLIGDATTRTHAGRALCLHAGELRKKGDPAGVTETTIAKHYTSQAAQAVASAAVQVHGGNGCLSGYGVERLYREAKVLEIIEGTSQMQQLMIAKYALQAYFKKPGNS